MFREEIDRHYLYAGDVFVTAKPTEITTVLGSCISVCLWDPTKGIGGINHYVSPVWSKSDPESNRYAEPSIDTLLQKMLRLGASKEKLICNVFGGGRVIDLHLDIGAENIRAAKEILRQKDIRVMEWDVGDAHGRKIQFNTYSGEIKLYKIRSLAESCGQNNRQKLKTFKEPNPVSS